MNEKEKETSLIPPVGNGEVITIEDSEDLISIAQRRMDTIQKLMDISLKITTYRDWVDQQGNPYLVHSGAERIARLFGIKLTGIQTARMMAEDSKGKYYIYKTTGTASLPGKYDSIEALGTCSQRDQFFSKAGGDWKDTINIDETNIMKASYSNFVVNAITHLLGFRNITWEQLKAAGIDSSKVTKVSYRDGSKKTEKTATAKELETQKKLWDLLIQHTGGSEEDAREMLKRESGFESKDGDKVDGRDDVKYLTGKWLNFTYTKIKKIVESRTPGEEG